MPEKVSEILFFLFVILKMLLQSHSDASCQTEYRKYMYVYFRNNNPPEMPSFQSDSPTTILENSY